ncbi:rod shape-determining protein MreD [Candidatus Margulisiibacteriota bacterium]
MRLLKFGSYVLLVLALQTVVFARLNLFGAAPDLVLISVILFAVLEDRKNALLFAAGAAFLQDILGHGIYLNMVVKLLVGYLVSSIKEGFAGDELFQAIGSTAVFTPLALLAEGVVYYLFFGRQIDVLAFAASLVLSTFFNVLLVPILFPLARRVARA